MTTTVSTRDLARPLAILFSELVDGAPHRGPYMLNHDDPGLLRSLDALSAAAASSPSTGGASIAGHVEHVRYGLMMMNRWAAGDPDPWRSADWTAAWRTTAVTEGEWAALRRGLGDEAHRFLSVLREPRDVDELGLCNMIGIVAHLAYHLGAIRQIDRTARGPSATD